MSVGRPPGFGSDVRKGNGADDLGHPHTATSDIDTQAGPERADSPYACPQHSPGQGRQAETPRLTSKPDDTPRGNFRLLRRPCAQIDRIMKINGLTVVTNDIITAACSYSASGRKAAAIQHGAFGATYRCESHIGGLGPRWPTVPARLPGAEVSWSCSAVTAAAVGR
jgi:hypothetical protein